MSAPVPHTVEQAINALLHPKRLYSAEDFLCRPCPVRLWVEVMEECHHSMTPSVMEGKMTGQMKGGFANAQFQVRQVRMEEGNS